jgi:hypothetical protein
MAAVDKSGRLCWALVKIDADDPRCIKSLVSPWKDDIRATLLRPGLVGTVSVHGVEFLRCGTNGFVRQGSVKLPLAAPVACCPAPSLNELIVITNDGTAFQVRHG